MAHDLSISGAYSPPAGAVDLSLSATSGGVNLALEGSYSAPSGLVNLNLGGAGSQEGVSGAIAAQLADLQTAIAGRLIISGALSAQLADLQAAIAGQYIVGGVISAQLSDLQAAFTGKCGADGILSAQLAGLQGLFTGGCGVSGTLSSTLAPLSVSCSGDYLINVWRGLVKASGLAYEAVPGRGHGESAVLFEQTSPRPEGLGLPWSLGRTLARSISSPVGNLAALPDMPVIAWAHGAPVSVAVSGTFMPLSPEPVSAPAAWERALHIAIESAPGWIYLMFRQTPAAFPYREASELAGTVRRLSYRGKPSCRPKKAWIPWEQADLPVFVWPPPASPEPPEPPEPVEPYRGNPDLNLECLLTAWGGYVPLYIPAICRRRRRAWIVINEIVLRRLSDGAVIPCTALEINGDIASWAWGWDAQVPLASSLSLLHPGEGPVEIEAVINGWNWRGITEGYTESRMHGQYIYSVAGRSRSAMLSAPYAVPRSYVLTEVRTARQLAEAEIAGTGWSLNWDTVDWLIPAGAWVYDRETPMSALTRIAAAVGAAIQTDPSALVLRALPRYAVSPWQWAAAVPDCVVSEDLLYNTSKKWESKPAYQGVYVSGISQGVLCRVYRAGTSGAPYQEMVTDPLITHADAGRERGRQELAPAGRWEIVGTELPVIAGGPGVLLPGMMIEVDAAAPWIGQVISCRISATPAYVRQSVEIERYLEGV